MAEAEASEAQGKLTEKIWSALEAEGFTALWVPRCFGGLELWPVESLNVIEALSYAHASTGWVTMASNGFTAAAAAYLPASGAKKLFAVERLPVMAGHGDPSRGRAVTDGGGLRLTGHWSYGSGILHAQWGSSGATVYEGGEPRFIPGTKVRDDRIFLTPFADMEPKGNWDVLGLRATGSIDYSGQNLFVPDEFTYPLFANQPNHGGDLYRMGLYAFGALGHTAFALGAGRRALDELANLATVDGKASALAADGGGEGFHEQYGLAEINFRGVRAVVHEVWHDLETTLQKGEDPTARQISLVRLAGVHSNQLNAELGVLLFRFAGGKASRASVLQRIFRDLQTAAQHAVVSPVITRECAKEMLGLSKDKVWGGRGLIVPETKVHTGRPSLGR